MRVSLAGPPLPAEAKRDLASRLIEAFAEVEVGHDSPEIRAGFVVQFEQLQPEDLWMGTRPMVDAGPSGRAAVVSAHVMAGPWNAVMKQELFARVERAIREVAAMPRTGRGADIWMTFVEVPEGGWGLGGRTVTIGRLAPAFAPEQRERIGQYLRSTDPSP